MRRRSIRLASFGRREKTLTGSKRNHSVNKSHCQQQRNQRKQLIGGRSSSRGSSSRGSSWERQQQLGHAVSQTIFKESLQNNINSICFANKNNITSSSSSTMTHRQYSNDHHHHHHSKTNAKLMSSCCEHAVTCE